MHPRTSQIHVLTLVFIVLDFGKTSVAGLARHSESLHRPNLRAGSLAVEASVFRRTASRRGVPRHVGQAAWTPGGPRG